MVPRPGLPSESIRPPRGARLHRIARQQPDGRVLDQEQALELARTREWYGRSYFVGSDVRFFVFAEREGA